MLIFVDKYNKGKAAAAADFDSAAGDANCDSFDESLVEVVGGIGGDVAGETAEESTKMSGVILDLNPKKFDKPKDSLFFDFFSLYGKRIVEDREKGFERVVEMEFDDE